MRALSEHEAQWAKLSQAERLQWATEKAGHLDQRQLRAAIFETIEGAGPFALTGADSSRTDRRQRLNMSRAAALTALYKSLYEPSRPRP